MKIVFYTSSLGGGGAEKHVQRIANATSQEGADVTVAVARRGGNFEDNLLEEIQLLPLTNTWFNSSTWQLMRSVRPLRRYLSRQSPDVVFGAMNHVNIRLMRAVQRMEAPPATVLSVQDNPYEKYGSDAGLRNRLLLWRMRRQYRHADRVVALSEGVGKGLVDMDIVDEEHLSVIYNAGIDDEVYRKKDAPLTKPRLPKDKAFILACGRLTPVKGYSYLLKAFRSVRSQHPAELWILGDGELREDLKHQINTLNLGDDVALLGFRDNPFKFMNAADVLALSSLSEGFGNVLVEAMACGTAVVSTACPYGPREIITHGENGLLVPPADVEALTEALLRVLGDQELQERLAENGRERARDFHAETIGEQYLDLFEEVVADTKESTSPEMIRAE